MTKTVAFANQKGGVGKTTSVYNMGHLLAAKGNKTLIIDLDPQASLTICAGLEPDEQDKTVVSVMQKADKPISDCVVKLQDDLDILPSRFELASAEMELMGRTGRELILKKAIAPVRNVYDYILIDCPPQMNILTINALAAAAFVVAPVKTDYLAYRGLVMLQETIEEVRDILNPELEFIGAIPTLYEMRVKDDNEVLQLIKDNYEVITVVKKLAIARKGIYDGLSVAQLAPGNEITKAYNEAVEFIASL